MFDDVAAVGTITMNRKPTMRLFTRTTAPVEATVGWVTAFICAWCWPAQWFSSVFPLPPLAGTEPFFTITGVLFGAYQIRLSFTRKWAARRVVAMLVAVFLTMMMVAVWVNVTWRMPGIPACLAGICVEIWVCIRLTVEQVVAGDA